LTYEEWYLANRGLLFDLCERDAFVRIVKNNGSFCSAIDIGSGTGRITASIAPLVSRMVAVDFSQQSLRVLNSKKIEGCSGLCADVSYIPFRDSIFDLAVSCQVLPLMQFYELLTTLREVNRILKQQGLFVFSVYNLHHWRSRSLYEYEAAGLYFKRFSVNYVYYLASKCNFEVKQIGYYKSLRLNGLNSKIWLVLDHLVCSMPWLNRALSPYMLVVFQKGK
jgi:ubiquinone/menaquinone biosynthesis C-methylase UbiE